jgi:hypothetical protein
MKGTKMKCQECHFENPKGGKFCNGSRADGWVEKYEAERAKLI